ncbi:MAG: hypothetical protein ACRDAX_04370 [Propionibacteriaceae bacterium]
MIRHGGVHELTDVSFDDGSVVRTGRSNDIEHRKGEHRRDPKTEGLGFESVYKTDDYDTTRGLEEVLYQEHPEAYMNKVKPISSRNGKAAKYRSAAKELLDKFKRKK